MTTLKLSGTMRTVDISKKRVHNDLVEAFVGTFEEEIAYDMAKAKNPQELTFDREWAEAKIRETEPKERLRIYLEWNGIFGYSTRIFEIATGEFES